MDPVTEILLDRERSRPKLLPWVILAVTLHAGAAAATFLVGRRTASRPGHLPVVAVKLVRPEPVRRQAPSRPPAARATPVPQPSAAPTKAPEPSAVPTAPPVEQERPSADAMPAADSAATPLPTPPPAPAGGSGGRGLSVGESNGGGARGIPADFHFTYYVERMLTLIESRWYKPGAPADTRARVGFQIQRDGRLTAVQLEESSGVPAFDRAALRALYAANPLPPLPPAYTKPSLTVHLSFTE